MDTSFLAEIGPTVWMGAKIAVVFGFVIYAIFAFVVVRQVSLMTKTLQLGLEPTLKVFAYLHFFFALILLAISIFIL